MKTKMVEYISEEIFFTIMKSIDELTRLKNRENDESKFLALSVAIENLNKAAHMTQLMTKKDYKVFT